MEHLKGKKEDASDVIGVHPLLPDNTCRFLVFVFDNHENNIYRMRPLILKVFHIEFLQ